MIPNASRAVPLPLAVLRAAVARSIAEGSPIVTEQRAPSSDDLTHAYGRKTNLTACGRDLSMVWACTSHDGMVTCEECAKRVDLEDGEEA